LLLFATTSVEPEPGRSKKWVLHSSEEVFVAELITANDL